tara:strand:+ start:352 stop:540 length:189 start_codon:yes stop_codon:yes gene_type:complete
MTPKQFKELRETLKTRQIPFAKFLGITERQLRRYENGETIIPGPINLLMSILEKRKIPKIPS